MNVNEDAIGGKKERQGTRGEGETDGRRFRATRIRE